MGVSKFVFSSSLKFRKSLFPKALNGARRASPTRFHTFQPAVTARRPGRKSARSSRRNFSGGEDERRAKCSAAPEAPFKWLPFTWDKERHLLSRLSTFPRRVQGFEPVICWSRARLSNPLVSATQNLCGRGGKRSGEILLPSLQEGENSDVITLLLHKMCPRARA